ncbi:MAG: ABC transporter permease [Chloracidobacterium sp.]|uniref:ABC transporter permease n=1 Tax=Chloracidobacterium validum TaxID=2821543 RepID=A0ABX8BD39_9BACT|nr:ABC transporter permease [Chloracidobacterium validum]QUW03455.1 ABC transporter permease [Chloracidobacterium validum]
MQSLAWANLQHRPARSLATVFGVAVGTVLVLLTTGLARGIIAERAEREARVGAHVMVRPPGSFGGGVVSNQPAYPLDKIPRMAAIPGVRAVVPAIQYALPSDSGIGFRLLEGVPWPDYAAMSGVQIVAGRAPQGPDEIVIDQEQARSRGFELGARVTLSKHAFTVVGIYAPPSGARIKAPLETLQSMLEAPGRCSLVFVQCQAAGEQEAVYQRLREAFPTDQIIFMRDLPSLYAGGLPALDTFLRVVVGLSLIISLLIVSLAMYTSVIERTREIGILKSLGATNTFILLAIEQEALLLSSLGAVLGIGLAYLGRWWIVSFTAFRAIEFDPVWFATVAVVALIGGGGGALYPAWRAMRLDPVEALRYE